MAGAAGWRWLVVAAGIVLLCSLPVLASTLPVSVPQMSAAQLRARILASRSMAFSGYAESDATFGLPPLGAFSSVADLLDGITKMEVWQASPTRWRVDTLSDASERDMYQAGTTTQYTWDSQQELLTEITGAQTIRLPVAADLVPSALAIRIITQAGSHATFGLLPPRRVAGQAAAGLRVTPTDPSSTIGQVDVWANPGDGLPLLVEILARGSTKPALESEFFQVSPWHPDSALLTPRHVPGNGFAVTSANAFRGVLSNVLSRPLPPTLDGRSLISAPVFGTGVYGNGLAPFVVLAIHGGYNFIEDAISAGATPFTSQFSHGAYASAPLVNLVLIHEPFTHAVFLLAGFVSRTVLMNAAQDLVAFR